MTDISLDLLSHSVPQYYFFSALMLWPVARIFRRAGFAPWWAAMLAVPMVGYILCAGFLTFRRWPSDRKGVA